jgi:glycosyltransferase involved in cell wall biosynthesis
MRKKLSIITINLNNSTGLDKTMKSVLVQSFQDYEYFVIDGGSTDNSIDVIKGFEKLYHQKVKIIWLSQQDDGIYNAMNKGIDLAGGEYLLFLNSGDTLVSPEILHTVFSNGFSEEYVYGNLNLVRNEDILYQDVKMSFDVPTLYNLYTECLPHQASFIKRELFEKYGKYDEGLKILGDWEFCIRTIIINNCSVRHIQYTITNYDMGGISETNSAKNKTEKNVILQSYFPDRIIFDLEKLVSYKNDFKIIDWYRDHRFYKFIMMFLYKAGKKIEKIIKK